MEYNKEQYDSEASVSTCIARLYDYALALGSSFILCFLVYTIYVLLVPPKDIAFIFVGYLPIVLVSVLSMACIMVIVSNMQSPGYKRACERYSLSGDVDHTWSQAHHLAASYGSPVRSIEANILFTIVTAITLSFSIALASPVVTTDDTTLVEAVQLAFNDYEAEVGSYYISLDGGNRMVDITVGSDSEIEYLDLSYTLNDTEELDEVSAFLEECSDRFNSINYSYDLELPEDFITQYESEGSARYSKNGIKIVGKENTIYYTVSNPLIRG